MRSNRDEDLITHHRSPLFMNELIAVKGERAAVLKQCVFALFVRESILPRAIHCGHSSHFTMSR